MKRTKILVIEDDLMIRNGYALVLRAENFIVLEAQDGMEGFEIANRERPDLILSDIMMPIMDGMDMLKKLRQGSDYEKNVPVIMLTNLNPNLAKVDERVPETGQVYYILKSDFTFKQVVGKIKEILAHKL